MEGKASKKIPTFLAEATGYKVVCVVVVVVVCKVGTRSKFTNQEYFCDFSLKCIVDI